jgi:uncharacterized protein (DUF302 family)
VAREDPHGVITLHVDGSIDQLLRRAVRQIEAFGFDVSAVIDHSGDAAEAGLTIPETKLVLFGHPKVITELIVGHPGLALELPFKLLICEDDRGHASITYLAADDLGERYALTDEATDTLRVVDAIARRTRG